MLLRYAARVNGLTELFVTKLDVLSGFETVRICTGYRADGEMFEDFPPHQSLFHKAEPVYEELDGWEEEIDEATSFEDLPKEARAYVHRMEELVGVPVSVVSVGPAREQSLAGRMRVLVVGGGGREHALCGGWRRAPRWTAARRARATPGIAAVATCVPVAADDVAGIVALVEREDVDLTVVGPGGAAGGRPGRRADRARAARSSARRATPPGSRAPRRGRRSCASATASRPPGRGRSPSSGRRVRLRRRLGGPPSS